MTTTSLTRPDVEPALLPAVANAGICGPDPAVLGIVLHRGVDSHLHQCLASLAAQRLPLAGIVVAQIGSGEPPTDVCERFPDVRLLAASGPASSAAVVEEIVSTFPADGYLFQEAEDWSAPDRLERLVGRAQATGAALVGSDYVVVAPRVPEAHTRAMPPDGNDAFQNGTGGPVVEPCTMLVDHRLIESLGGFNTNLSVAAANEFVARAAVAARVVNVSRAVYFHREHEAPDWSGSSSGDSIVGRVVSAAMSERSRHHAVSLARRQRPDVAVREQRRLVRLLHLAGPTGPVGRPPAGLAHPAPSPTPTANGSSITSEPSAPLSPIFVVSAFDSLSRFVACGLGQHPRLLTVDVTPWMSQIAQLAARYLEAERRGEGVSRLGTAATADSVYRAASTAVDALFVGGPFAGHGDPMTHDGDVRRWVGAVAAEPNALMSAALLYPEATFVHVTRPVDETVAAQLEAQDDADVEELYTAWLSATHAILDLAQLLEVGRMQILRYDELVRAPEAVMRGFLESIGERPEPACAALVVRSGADAPARPAALADLAGVPAQSEARRVSIALSGRSAAAHEADRSRVMTTMLAAGSGETLRRRRATDIREDDRNPYAASHDLVRRYAAKNAIVCVVSKGDEMAVRIRGHSLGWHFPQTEDGAYAGYHPTDAREAIAHLEHLRDRGAELFLIPKVYMWWLNHYGELRLHLERTYERVASTEDEGALFDLRSGATQGELR